MTCGKSASLDLAASRFLTCPSKPPKHTQLVVHPKKADTSTSRQEGLSVRLRIVEYALNCPVSNFAQTSLPATTSVVRRGTNSGVFEQVENVPNHPTSGCAVHSDRRNRSRCQPPPQSSTIPTASGFGRRIVHGSESTANSPVKSKQNSDPADLFPREHVRLLARSSRSAQAETFIAEHDNHCSQMERRNTGAAGIVRLIQSRGIKRNAEIHVG